MLRCSYLLVLVGSQEERAEWLKARLVQETKVADSTKRQKPPLPKKLLTASDAEPPRALGHKEETCTGGSSELAEPVLTRISGSGPNKNPSVSKPQHIPKNKVGLNNRRECTTEMEKHDRTAESKKNLGEAKNGLKTPKTSVEQKNQTGRNVLSFFSTSRYFQKWKKLSADSLRFIRAQRRRAALKYCWVLWVAQVRTNKRRRDALTLAQNFVQQCTAKTVKSFFLSWRGVTRTMHTQRREAEIFARRKAS